MPKCSSAASAEVTCSAACRAFRPASLVPGRPSAAARCLATSLATASKAGGRFATSSIDAHAHARSSIDARCSASSLGFLVRFSGSVVREEAGSPKWDHSVFSRANIQNRGSGASAATNPGEPGAGADNVNRFSRTQRFVLSFVRICFA